MREPQQPAYLPGAGLRPLGARSVRAALIKLFDAVVHQPDTDTRLSFDQPMAMSIKFVEDPDRGTPLPRGCPLAADDYQRSAGDNDAAMRRHVANSRGRTPSDQDRG